MYAFAINSIESYPETSRQALQACQSAFGFIPNVAGAMSTSPVLINSLVPLFGNVHGGSFSEAQIQPLLLTNGATWPVAFHSLLAMKEGVDPVDVEAIRNGRIPKDEKHAALSILAKKLIEKRGGLVSHHLLEDRHDRLALGEPLPADPGQELGGIGLVERNGAGRPAVWKGQPIEQIGRAHV